MAIKMRHNNDKDAFCDECGEVQNNVINMFDLCIAGHIHTLCDLCNNKVLGKTLSAEVFKNGRVKSQRDMKIKYNRNRKGLT
ncbi:MAG: hypothetical protein PHN69_05335 [Candidatus Pacebacteria bacterium]|nr:hypothetical protein [Candidatus Paceibacterota bacterium]